MLLSTKHKEFVQRSRCYRFFKQVTFQMCLQIAPRACARAGIVYVLSTIRSSIVERFHIHGNFAEVGEVVMLLKGRGGSDPEHFVSPWNLIATTQSNVGHTTTPL